MAPELAPPLILAIALVATMGFATQRGATCAVAAVDEIIVHRRARRVRAMATAALWVGGLLGIAQLAGLMPGPIPGHGATLAALAGGIVLGLGAFINRACVFGAVARLGSGEWAYAMTPVGFYAGCLAFPGLGTMAGPPLAPMGDGRAMAALVTVAFLGWLLLGLRRRAADEAPLWDRIWAPHGATVLIGALLAILTLFAGAWTYMDGLMALARDPMSMGTLAWTLLFLALLAGAIAGGAARGYSFAKAPPLGRLLRCFIGGFVMAIGSLLVPGSNDGLILVGLVMAWPHALVAVPVMGLTIAAAMLAEARLKPSVAA
jgi:toxin CptA